MMHSGLKPLPALTRVKPVNTIGRVSYKTHECPGVVGFYSSSSSSPAPLQKIKLENVTEAYFLHLRDVVETKLIVVLR